ncbi:transposase [Patescibacteria group bacterium]|nr:transposase [Patescibacteria group bacterium]
MAKYKKYKIKKQYRLPGYDYSSHGYYFVTICTNDKINYLGAVKNGQMVLNKLGETCLKYWLNIPKYFPFAELDEFVIMPNHVHGIIFININVGTEHCAAAQCSVPTKSTFDAAAQCSVPTKSTFDAAAQCSVPTLSTFGHVAPKSLSTIIRTFKATMIRYVHKKFPHSGFAWQSRFHDRIIRDERALNNIREYIMNNPFNWEYDRNHPKNPPLPLPGRSGKCGPPVLTKWGAVIRYL